MANEPNYELIPTLEEQNKLEEWCVAARVYPADGVTTLIQIAEFLLSNQLPFTFEAINAAVGSSALHGKLKFRRVASPENWREISAQWLKTLPEGLQAGLPIALASKMADILEREYDNTYSIDNLNAIWPRVQGSMLPTPEVKPEPSKKDALDALMGQGGREQTGRRNYAHDNDTPAPPTDSKMAEKVMKTLQGLASGGHTAFARQTNAEVKQMMQERKPLSEIHDYVHNVTADYLAGAAIAKLLQDAPGATNGERINNRENMQRIVRQGQLHGMSKPDIARLVKQQHDAATSRSIR